MNEGASHIKPATDKTVETIGAQQTTNTLNTSGTETAGERGRRDSSPKGRERATEYTTSPDSSP